MPKKKEKQQEAPPKLGKQGEPAPISNISSKLSEEYKDRYWRLTQQKLALQSKLDEKKDELKALEKEIKEVTAGDGALWSQIEFAF